jgi:TonB family protein
MLCQSFYPFSVARTVPGTTRRLIGVLLFFSLWLINPGCFAQKSRLEPLPVTLEEVPERYLIPVQERNPFLEPLHDDYTIVNYAERMPSFKGYPKRLQKYLKEQLHYPPAAAARQITGTVFIGFTVQSDGSVADARVLKGIGYGCDEEALRVVKAMPPWEPAMQSGRPIPMPYSLPIRFQWVEPEKPRKRWFGLSLPRTFSR